MKYVRDWGLVLALASAACSDDAKPKEEGCKPDDLASCDDGLVCEQLGSAEEYACLAPVIVRGRVLDALDGSGISDATVVGLDANGAARTRVARSDAQGNYELPVSVRRNADGSPVMDAITLRADAADHQAFPTAPRTALPIQLGLAQPLAAHAPATTARYAIENAATEVALIPLPESERGGATIAGRVAVEGAAGTLVLAVRDDSALSSAVSDLDGAFVLFNVPQGALTLEGYRAGLAVTPVTVSVGTAGLANVVLESSRAALGSVAGNLQIVNATGGLSTSVILVVASTFDPHVVRGEAPAGLRAGSVSGDFRIEQVPPGRYAVLAAFENDQLVRDPDEGIGGTEVVFVDVGAGAGAVTLDQGFKVTEALRVVAPGAESTEQMQAGEIMLSWVDDSSEDGYELRVYDALGALVHEDTAVPLVTGSANVRYALDASSFEPGMLYQFRVWSWRERRAARTYISASEDLRGVFEIAR